MVLRQATLTARHKPTGNTRHYDVSGPLPAPRALRIASYPGDAGYYLLYLDEAGRELTDTYHESMEDALAQAEWEFGIKPEEWEELPP